MTASNKEKIRKIYEALPKLNCGLCGYGNCGQFAKAVAEGRASPFGCRQNPWPGYRISEIIGAEVPAHGHRFQQVLLPELRVSSSTMNLKTLREEFKELSQGVDDILARIENLKTRR
ncbi:hypothetical protein KAU37_00425 [Candidatus Bipolaricaulota bacterium]|nr:hypothetical protein [Candidatus Bipolaricaulota bacterium]